MMSNENANEKFPADFKQNFENFPVEFSTQPRFFELIGNSKTDTPKGWSKPENQKKLTDCNGLIGFDTTGHGNAADYCFLDFDHVLKADGDFVNDSVADTVNALQLTFPNIYIEKSVSGTGLHAFIVPTDGAFEKMTAGNNFSLNFGDSAKLEIFYKTSARYCLLTGNKYDEGDEIPRGEKVDEFLKNLLAEIQKQNPAPKKTDKNISPINQQEYFDDPPEYVQDLAIFLLKHIPCKPLSDSDWLSVNSSCKTLNLPANVIEQWNKSDLERYNAKENQKRFQSLLDPSFAIENLIGKAPYADIKNFKKQWYKDHTEFKRKNFSADTKIDSVKIELQEINKKIADFDAEKIAAIEKLRSAEHFDKDFVFSDEILTAAAFAKLYDGKIFSNFKFAVQNQNKKEKFIQEWLGAVKDKIADITERKSELSTQRNSIQANLNSLIFIADNNILSNFTIPEGFSISDEHGIEKVVGDKLITVCRRPVIIKSELADYENKTYKLILSYKSTNGKWKDIPAQNADIIFNHKKLVDLAFYKLPVTSVNAAALVDFFDAFRNDNEIKFPMSYTVSRCGWYEFGEKEFFVDPRRDCTFTEDDKNHNVIVDSASQFANSLKSKGTLEEWKKAYDLAKNSPVARLMTAASIAPPLLKILGERNFLLYVHAPTRAGKTTALYLGASAVGDEKIIRSFDATKNGLAGAAADVNDYPFLIDEKQVADNRLKDQLADLVYSLANGVGRTRLNKDSTLKKLQDWRTIAIATGETTLLADNVTGGAYSRLISIQAPKEILDADTCKIIRDIIKKNYGLILPLFIDELLKYGFNNLREKYQEIWVRCTKNFPALLPEYCRYIALLSISDIFLNMCLGVERGSAINDTEIFAKKIFELIPTREEISDTAREKDFVLGFIAQNQKYFLGATSAQIENLPFVYGKFDDDFVFVTVAALKKACSNDKFDHNKLVADLVENKFFVPDDKIRKGRKTPYQFVQKKLSGANTNCYRIPREFVSSDN